MSELEFVGALVGGLAGIFGLFFLLGNHQDKKTNEPIQKLTTEISLLNNNLQFLREGMEKTDRDIVDLKDVVVAHDKRISHHQYLIEELKDKTFIKDRKP